MPLGSPRWWPRAATVPCKRPVSAPTAAEPVHGYCGTSAPIEYCVGLDVVPKSGRRSCIVPLDHEPETTSGNILLRPDYGLLRRSGLAARLRKLGTFHRP